MKKTVRAEVGRLAGRMHEPVHHDVDRGAALRVCLRIEKSLDVTHIVGSRPTKIGHGHVPEVALGRRTAVPA